MGRKQEDLEDLYARAVSLLEGGTGALGDEALLEAGRALGEPPAEAEVTEALELSQRGARQALAEGDPMLASDFLRLGAEAHSQLGDFAKGLALLDEALKHDPDSLEAALERAIALFELCRFDESRKAFAELAQAEPEEAWSHHYLGLLAERRRDEAEAKKRFGEARRLAPDEFPKPVSLSDKEFDAALEAAMKSLTEEVRRHLENTTVAVEPFPSDEDLLAEAPPLSPTLLGLFKGTPIGERSVTNAFDHFPSAIVLYQRNLERFARTKAELIEQIAITLKHEVGHLVGLDEDDLAERGLE